jgi:hypothetical protein
MADGDHNHNHDTPSGAKEVGVGDAGLGAVKARPDALHERVFIHGRLAVVGVGQRRTSWLLAP